MVTENMTWGIRWEERNFVKGESSDVISIRPYIPSEIKRDVEREREVVFIGYGFEET